MLIPLPLVEPFQKAFHHIIYITMNTFIEWLMLEMPIKLNLVGDWGDARKKAKSGGATDTQGSRLTINPRGEDSFTSRMRRRGIGSKLPSINKSVKGIHRYPSSTILQLTSDAGREKIIRKFKNVPEGFVANFVIDP